MLERLRANRDFCWDALSQMKGFTVPKPEGAFYLFPAHRRIDRFVRDIVNGCLRKPGSVWLLAWRSARVGRAASASVMPPKCEFLNLPWNGCNVSRDDGISLQKHEVAKLIDHTILKPDAVRADIERVCREALQYNFASVCVNPCWIPLVAKALAGSEVKVCSVVAFPFGATATAAKVAESEIVMHEGATELDMVINIGALRSGDNGLVGDDIAAVVSAAHSRRRHCESDYRKRHSSPTIRSSQFAIWPKRRRLILSRLPPVLLRAAQLWPQSN